MSAFGPLRALRRSDPVLLAAVPVMDELARKARLDAVLSTIYGLRLVDTFRAGADPTLRLSYGRGRPRPLFLGAAPEVILANMGRPQLVKVYEAAKEEAAAGGLGNTWTEFRTRLAEIRRDDFYWSHGELEPKVSGAAVPIFDADGEVAAALALVGPSKSVKEVGERRLKIAAGTRERRDPGAAGSRRRPPTSSLARARTGAAKRNGANARRAR